MRELKTMFKRVVSDGSLIKKVETEQIDDDQIFVLESITGGFNAQAVTEVSQFYFSNGGNPYYFDSKLPLATGVNPSSRERITIPAGFSFGVYCPDVANNEILTLYVHGYKIPLCDYRNYYMLQADKK